VCVYVCVCACVCMCKLFLCWASVTILPSEKRTITRSGSELVCVCLCVCVFVSMLPLNVPLVCTLIHSILPPSIFTARMSVRSVTNLHRCFKNRGKQVVRSLSAYDAIEV